MIQEFKPISLWSPNPSTGERGTSTKLSSNHKSLITYPSGRSIFIKNIDTLDSISYTGHIHQTTVAKFSPSGNYIASGDVTGGVRVWDVVGEDQVLKVEVKAISGRINDLAWDSDNGGKRIIAVGEGRERYGHAFTIDGGNSVGEIGGHSKTIRAVCMKASRPYRAVTASDDTTLAFFQGTPYKYEKTIKTHTKFIQSVEYSSNDNQFASSGSDSKIFLYNGTTGEMISELTLDEPHSGTVFSISWSKFNSNSLTSFSADGSVKLWDTEKQKHVKTWTIAKNPLPEQQQVGGTWVDEHRFCSLSYNGDLTVLDERDPNPVKTIYGVQKGIISATKNSNELYAGDHSGRVVKYSDQGCCELIGKSNGSNIISISQSKSKIYSIGLDDQVRFIDPKSGEYSSTEIVPLPEQPKAIATRPTVDNITLVVTSKEARLVSDGNALVTIPLDYSATACAFTADYAAIGSTDGKVHIYKYSSNKLTHSKTLDIHKSSISIMSTDPSGKVLASGDDSGKIMVIELNESFKVRISNQWCWHTGKVFSLDWNKDGTCLVSGGLDTNVFIWYLEKPMRKIAIKNAHVGGTTMVGWENKDGNEKKPMIVTCGADGAVRRFQLDLEKLLKT
ncbi:WD40-repeat-containing domain protein [Melampsora americana]|nr:WD40-repeat-containing domain protein [Melampsora americana]